MAAASSWCDYFFFLAAFFAVFFFAAAFFVAMSSSPPLEVKNVNQQESVCLCIPEFARRVKFCRKIFLVGVW
ncbi:MAG: hypothetical protein OEV08_00775 [Nitrospira sp.]|nr:hypothetical protein [Nitrospira sp.]